VRHASDPEFRAFFGNGTGPTTFLAPPDADRITELRGVSGGTMLVGRDSTPAPKVALTGGTVSIAPMQDERALFAGLNTILAFRLHEDAATVADWLAYHARHHGLQAALIVDRAAPSTDAVDFAAALEKDLAVRDLPPLRVVIVTPGLPLGTPGMPAETEVYSAHDAPGRAQMQPPPADPWLSTLGEELVLELMKWWFLADARAVLLLEVIDLLVPRTPAETSAFDLCAGAARGVVTLVGQRIYPWRVRRNRAPQFGDHICRQVDAPSGILRWGVAPRAAGLDKTWRKRRISYGRPEPDHIIRFWRAMAVRIPEPGKLGLAPKSSLIEDPQLLSLMQGEFGFPPLRPPTAQMKSERHDRTCIVTAMKNEGPFILEWLAYHRAIGVEDILVYTNDCTDGTDTMLMLLQDKGLLQHRVNPWKPQDPLRPQFTALQAALAEPIVQNAGWIISMDADEFINIKLGDGRLPTLYAAMQAALPGANMISLTWRLFGNGDVQDYTDTFLTRQFHRCAPEIVRKPHQAWGFKTLFRNLDIYKKIGLHRPKGLVPSLGDQIKWLNGSGRQMPSKMLRDGWRSTLDTYGYDWVQLNHYAVRSAESFLVKRERGRANHADRELGLAYWFRMNHNAEEDRSIQTRLPMLQAEWDRLMADPDIRAAHDHSVACHRAKIAALRATPAYADFFADLTGPRLQSLSRRLKHFGTAVFNAGPGVIPDDIALAPHLPEGFFFTIKGVETEEAPQTDNE
jgi:hypothetical protein